MMYPTFWEVHVLPSSGGINYVRFPIPPARSLASRKKTARLHARSGRRRPHPSHFSSLGSEEEELGGGCPRRHPPLASSDGSALLLDFFLRNNFGFFFFGAAPRRSSPALGSVTPPSPRSDSASGGFLSRLFKRFAKRFRVPAETAAMFSVVSSRCAVGAWLDAGFRSPRPQRTTTRRKASVRNPLGSFVVLSEPAEGGSSAGGSSTSVPCTGVEPP